MMHGRGADRGKCQVPSPGENDFWARGWTAAGYAQGCRHLLFQGCVFARGGQGIAKCRVQSSKFNSRNPPVQDFWRLWVPAPNSGLR
jgi:hypothetical protein